MSSIHAPSESLTYARRSVPSSNAFMTTESPAVGPQKRIDVRDREREVVELVPLPISTVSAAVWVPVQLEALRASGRL